SGPALRCAAGGYRDYFPWSPRRIRPSRLAISATATPPMWSRGSEPATVNTLQSDDEGVTSQQTRWKLQRSLDGRARLRVARGLAATHRKFGYSRREYTKCVRSEIAQVEAGAEDELAGRGAAPGIEQRRVVQLAHLHDPADCEREPRP